MKDRKSESVKLVSFLSAADNMPQGLPLNVLTFDFANSLKSEYGINKPYTMYDQWAMVMTGLETAQSFFNGDVVSSCNLLQVASEDDKRLLDGIHSIFREKMMQSYMPSRVAVTRYLRSMGIPYDTSSFDRRDFY